MTKIRCSLNSIRTISLYRFPLILKMASLPTISVAGYVWRSSSKEDHFACCTVFSHAFSTVRQSENCVAIDIRPTSIVSRFARSRKTPAWPHPATLRGKALDLNTGFPCRLRHRLGIQSPLLYTGCGLVHRTVSSACGPPTGPSPHIFARKAEETFISHNTSENLLEKLTLTPPTITRPIPACNGSLRMASHSGSCYFFRQNGYRIAKETPFVMIKFAFQKKHQANPANSFIFNTANLHAGLFPGSKWVVFGLKRVTCGFNPGYSRLASNPVPPVEVPPGSSLIGFVFQNGCQTSIGILLYCLLKVGPEEWAQAHFFIAPRLVAEKLE